MKKGIIMLIGLNLVLGSCLAQESTLFTQHKFHLLNEEDGLLNSVILDIVQDSLGLVWVATENGLHRFRGNHFESFRVKRGDSNSLPDNYVNKLFIDHTNRIWALTEFGIATYTYESDELVQFKPSEITGSITSMDIDRDGTLYFGRHSGGIWYGKDSFRILRMFDPSTGMDFSNEGVIGIRATERYLWVALIKEGIVRYDLETGATTYIAPLDLSGNETIIVFDFTIDHSGNLWFATDNGVYWINGSETENIEHKRILEGTLSKDDYLSIVEDDKSTLWLGSRQHGLHSFRNDFQGHVSKYQRFTPKEGDEGIDHRTVSKVYIEESGLIWLGTHNAGINVFDPNGQKIRLVTQKQNETNTLSYKNVWGISPSKEGHIWVGTDGKGLNLLNPETGLIIKSKWDVLDNKAILSVLEDSKGRLWIGTYASGMYLADPNSGRIENYNTTSDNSELKVNDIRAIYETQDGQILIGANVGGLYHFSEVEKKIKYLNGSNGIDIRAIEERDGLIYLGTFRSGLIICDLNRTPNTFQEVHHLDQEKPFVITGLLWENDTLWLATRENGLVGFDMHKQEFRLFEDDHILRNIAVAGVCSDFEGRLWLTTNNGIYQYDRKSIKSFQQKDGIQLGRFNHGSIFFSAEGYIAAGGINGMNLFYPKEVLSQSQELEVVFNELKVLDKSVKPSDAIAFPKEKSIYLTDQINFEYYDNLFSISFSIPGFPINKPNEFLFMLEGYDMNWTSGSIAQEATYRNVPPGDYVFKIKNPGTGSMVKELNLTVAAPFWKTWQAYLLFSSVVLGALYVFVRFNASRIKLRQQLLFEKELRENEQKSMQEKLRFYTNFSHELKTPLTLIQGPVNDLIRSTKDQNHLQYLQLIKKNTSILLKFIGRMLEFRKIEMNKVLLNVGYYDLNILAQEEAESFGLLAKDKGILFGFYCENNLNAWVDIEKIQIVLNNLLSNAIKFSKPGMKVKFGVFIEKHNIVIEVQDEGEGLPDDEKNKIFTPFYQSSNSSGYGGTGIGLALCKNFIVLHGGTIEVLNGHHAGLKLIARLPIGKKHLEGKSHVRFVDTNQDDYQLDSQPEYFEIEGGQEVIEETDKVALVVDDNHDISAYIASLLSPDFKVIKSDNGQDAFEKAVKSLPDIIISDLMMPGLDGYELCKMLKENIATSHVPIILLTAKNSNQSQIEGYEVGADDYIAKPFDSELLKVRVDNIISRRKLLELKYSSQELIDQSVDQSAKEVEFILRVESTVLAMVESSEFTVADLCKELGMSQTSLYRKVKMLTNDSIQLFIRKIKIKRAAEMLLQEDTTVTEVSFALNFADLKYFRKCFKDQYGLTPSEYKKQKIKTPDFTIAKDTIQ